MAVTKESPFQDPQWNVFKEQLLARQRNTDQLLEIVNSLGSFSEGEFESLEDVVTALVTSVNKLNTVVDVTNETEDYSLSVNETAKITISAASTELNIEVEDGVYEIDIIFDPSTFAANSAIGLRPNNTTHTDEIVSHSLRSDVGFATDEVDVTEDTTTASFNLIFGSAGLMVARVHSTLIIMGDIASLHTEAFGFDNSSGNYRGHSVRGLWDSGTTYTSLGTLVLHEAATGVAYVKRIA